MNKLPAKAQRAINLDLRRIKGAMNTMFKECVGAGRANEGLRADWQNQLAFVRRTCGFKYIRMHGLLSDDMGVYKEDDSGLPEYNFQYLDVLFDFIVGIGMRPFVELGFMPAALASGDQTIFWWKGNTTPPKDYGKWEGLVEAVVRHLKDRYGADEVGAWYFEVWNEPNLGGFWSGTQAEYFELYRFSAKAIKRVDGRFRVGGPATAGAAWVPDMIDFCVKNSLPLDFVSTHSYGVKQGFLDEFGTTGTILCQDEWSVSGDVVNSRKQIAESALPGLELHYTEWSSSYTPHDPIHDSYHQAAYILQKIKQVGDAADSLSYWVFTDIFEEAGPRFAPFHGGFGLLNYQGIAKPAFYAYAFLNKLGDTELENSDASSWACRNSEGDAQLLFWDFTNTHPGDSVNNQAYYIRDLPASAKGSVEVRVAGLPPGDYLLDLYKIGYAANDPYAAYLAMGKPRQLTQRQVNAIKELNDGSPFRKALVKVAESGVFEERLDIDENDVILLSLKKL